VPFDLYFLPYQSAQSELGPLQRSGSLTGWMSAYGWRSQSVDATLYLKERWSVL
jgi:hypothetical protein